MEEEKTHKGSGIFHRLLTLLSSNETVAGILLAVLVGAIAGFGAVLFRWLLRALQTAFFSRGGDILGFMGQYYIIILPAIGGLIVGLIVYFGAREAKGHGVPEVMEAVAVRGGRIRPRVALIKSLASAFCIGSGGSVGREGPIVQIGSSLGSTIGQVLHLSEDWVRTLVACGAAGGISATFNAPIGGVFFAMEIILGRFVTPRFGFVVISSVVADFIGRAFLGSQASFGTVPYSLISYWELIPYAILGITAGVVAVIFIRLLYKCEDLFEAWKIPDYLKPAVGGIIIGLIGLYSVDLFGVGYGEAAWESQMGIDQALVGGIALQSLLALLVLKVVATSLTLGSGGSGGVFAPSLFIGAMLGGVVGTVAHNLFPGETASMGAYVLVGMAAVFSGTARAPITAIIMLFEMTLDYRIILPLMIAVVISTIVARSINRESIYTAKLVRRGIDIRQLELSSPLKGVKVGEVMEKNFPTVLPTLTIQELINRLRRSEYNGLPVVDAEGGLVGMVTDSDVEAALSRGDFTDLTVDDIAVKSLVVAYPDEYVHDVFVKLGAREVGRIPVVERGNPKHMLGVLRRRNIMQAYAKAVTQKQPD
jgi:CIC family chloride channel protein